MAGTHEHRLLNDLLGSYQVLERPVDDENKPVKMNFNIILNQIIDLNEREQLLKTNMWLDYDWTDVNLIWNSVSIYFFPSLYFQCNLDEIHADLSRCGDFNIFHKL